MDKKTKSNLFFSLDTIEKVKKNGRTTLGKGGCGKVDLIHHKLVSDQLFAMKTICLRSGITLKEVQNEIRMHQRLNHKNIIKIFGFQIHERKAYLFLEYAKFGDLFQLLQKKKTSLPILSKKNKIKIFHECVTVICHMHDTGILHRDIKPENILLDEKMNVKLCDFDWAIDLSEENRRKSLCGTIEYMAPEIYNGEIQTEKTDIWALGKKKNKNNLKEFYFMRFLKNILHIILK